MWIPVKSGTVFSTIIDIKFSPLATDYKYDVQENTGQNIYLKIYLNVDIYAKAQKLLELQM